jgi:hypothetical protein
LVAIVLPEPVPARDEQWRSIFRRGEGTNR